MAEDTASRVARVEAQLDSLQRNTEQRVALHEVHDQERFLAIGQRFDKTDLQMDKILSRIDELVTRTWQLVLAVVILGTISGGASAAAVTKAMALFGH